MKPVINLRAGLLLGLALCLTVSGLAQPSSARPNIVYILADDMGYGDLSCLNKASKISTPAMDALAKAGVYFTDAHSNSAVCTPTRYGILTGRYAFRSSLKNGVLYGYSPPLIEKGRITVASFLKGAGYHTACIGKWHLGLDWTKKDVLKPLKDSRSEEKPGRDFDDNVDYSKAVTDGPADHGFDYSFIIPSSLDIAPYFFLRNNKPVSAAVDFTNGSGENAGRGSLRRPGLMQKGFQFEQVLPTFINDAIDYIGREATTKTKAPFFLYLALPSPHTPWVPTDEFKKKTGIGNYGDYVAETDYLIGKVLAALDKAGLTNNTLVMVTSDNGSDWNPQDIEKSDHKANYIFKGRKADIYEAGHRVPFLARWPGKIPAGSSSSQTMCTTDLLATAAAIIGKPVPAGAGEDSYNMLDAFTGKKKDGQIREAIIHHSIQGVFAIRKGDWKLTTELGSGGFSTPKKIEPAAGEPPMTLYNMATDPEEKNNLYNEHPEVVKELLALLEKYKAQGYSSHQ